VSPGGRRLDRVLARLLLNRYPAQLRELLNRGLAPEAAAEILDVARDVLGARYFKLRETDQPLGRVTFSGGVAWGRHPDGTSALQRADALLYAAKNGGRDRVHWETAQAQAA